MLCGASECSEYINVRATLHRVASVTKVFPAHLMYQAHAAGDIDMHEAVVARIAGFAPINPFSSSNISWHQLASQLSGLSRAGPPECLLANCTNTVALDHLRTRFLKWPPGTQPAYSNWAFGLLGNLLSEEILKDSSFATSAHSRIVVPLGLQNTGMMYTPDVLDRLAVGYTLGQADPFTTFGYSAPAASAYSTVADLTLYGQTLLAAYHGDTKVVQRHGGSRVALCCLLSLPSQLLLFTLSR